MAHHTKCSEENEPQSKKPGTNQAAQLLEIIESLEFRIYKEEESYYLCMIAKTHALISCVFSKEQNRFSQIVSENDCCTPLESYNVKRTFV